MGLHKSEPYPNIVTISYLKEFLLWVARIFQYQNKETHKIGSLHLYTRKNNNKSLTFNSSEGSKNITEFKLAKLKGIHSVFLLLFTRFAPREHFGWNFLLFACKRARKTQTTVCSREKVKSFLTGKINNSLKSWKILEKRIKFFLIIVKLNIVFILIHTSALRAHENNKLIFHISNVNVAQAESEAFSGVGREEIKNALKSKQRHWLLNLVLIQVF